MITIPYGYSAGTYYRRDGTTFVGWNGNKTETKPADSILEEALIVNTNFLSPLTATDFSKGNKKEKTLAEPGL